MFDFCQDYQEHQAEIYSKLILIMSERLNVHAKAIQSMDWNGAVVNGDEPSAYMKSLVKEVATLHKVLSRYLPTDRLQVCILFRRSVLLMPCKRF
jgi:vacuolar protein sorting-associated protein 54